MSLDKLVKLSEENENWFEDKKASSKVQGVTQAVVTAALDRSLENIRPTVKNAIDFHMFQKFQKTENLEQDGTLGRSVFRWCKLVRPAEPCKIFWSLYRTHQASLRCREESVRKV